MKLKLNNRVADCDVVRGATRDIVDAYVEQGEWEDGDTLTEAECNAIDEANRDLIEEYAMSDLGCYS